jgi:ubiquitin-like protein Pup
MPTGPSAKRQAAARPLLDGVDGLLDEIDEVLEANAEEFVRGYVQKGGE